MKKRVKEIKNLKGEFNIKEVLRSNTDCIIGFGEVLNNGETNIYVYNNMESGERIEIPEKYVRIFEENNYIFNLAPVIITKEKSKALRKRIKESKTNIVEIQNCSSR